MYSHSSHLCCLGVVFRNTITKCRPRRLNHPQHWARCHLNSTAVIKLQFVCIINRNSCIPSVTTEIHWYHKPLQCAEINQLSLPFRYLEILQNRRNINISLRSKRHCMNVKVSTRSLLSHAWCRGFGTRLKRDRWDLHSSVSIMQCGRKDPSV